MADRQGRKVGAGMSARTHLQRSLALVETPPSAAAALAEVVPEMAALEQRMAATRRRFDQLTRALARERGVAFIRAEHVRREFAK